MYDDSFKARYGTAPIAISETVGEIPTYAHIHNEIEILYILKGKSRIRIADKSYDAAEGDIFFVNPLEVHAVTVNDGSDYKHKCICFDADLIVDKDLSTELLLSKKYIIGHISKGETNRNALIAYFNNLYTMIEKNDNVLLFDVSAMVSLIFSALLKGKYIVENRLKDKATRFCIEVIQYLSLNFSNQLTSCVIAKDLFYNNSYFCRAFKRNFGVSFSEYLTMYRVFIAKQMLKSTDDKIIDIAEACGFGSASYFTKCFTKIEGISPLKYRKSQNNTSL